MGSEMCIKRQALWSDVCDRVLPCMSATSAAKFGSQLTFAMVADLLPGSAHSVSVELANFWQLQLLHGRTLEGSRYYVCCRCYGRGAVG